MPGARHSPGQNEARQTTFVVCMCWLVRLWREGCHLSHRQPRGFGPFVLSRDLKRDIAAKLEKLERRTNKAIAMIVTGTPPSH